MRSADGAAAGIDLVEAAVLGLVEGITEYLPVSSTGHLILAERALGIPDDEASRAFAICIQSGAILAVVGLYARRVRALAAGVVGRDPAGRRLALALVVAFLPAAVIGKLFDERIEETLFGLWPVVVAWLAGGIAILAIPSLREGRDRTRGIALEDLRIPTALAIGLAQCLALWPGTSRSLATIGAGLLLGLSGVAAVEFSLLLGLLTLLAATGYKAVQSGPEMIDSIGLLPLAVGLAVAWVSAAAAVRWLVGYLQGHGLAVFGWYRIALAIAVSLLARAGWVATS